MVGKYDFTLIQGSDTEDIEFTLTEDDGTPILLNGYTAKAQLRKTVNSSEVLDELTTENSRIVIEDYVEDDITYWRVILKFPGSVTKNYTIDKAVYDVDLYIDHKENRILEGCIVINPEVTRE